MDHTIKIQLKDRDGEVFKEGKSFVLGSAFANTTIGPPDLVKWGTSFFVKEDSSNDGPISYREKSCWTIVFENEANDGLDEIPF